MRPSTAGHVSSGIFRVRPETALRRARADVAMVNLAGPFNSFLQRAASLRGTAASFPYERASLGARRSRRCETYLRVRATGAKDFRCDLSGEMRGSSS